MGPVCELPMFSGGRTRGDLPVFNTNGETPVEALVVFIISKHTFGSALTHPFDSVQHGTLNIVSLFCWSALRRRWSVGGTLSTSCGVCL